MLRRPSAWVFALALVLACSGTCCAPPAQRAIVAPALASVVHIRTWSAPALVDSTDRPTISSWGSAVIVSGEGYALTARHCTEVAAGHAFGGLEVEVGPDDWRPCQVIERAGDVDLALILLPSVAGRHWRPAEISPDRVRPGDTCYAVGFPFSLNLAVSRGIVSAINAVIPGDPDLYIQTDAACNPGSSGGGLFDARGRLTGILDAIANPSARTFCGLAYAEPMSEARGLLRRHGLGKLLP